jgi:hypothetical protein
MPNLNQFGAVVPGAGFGDLGAISGGMSAEERAMNNGIANMLGTDFTSVPNPKSRVYGGARQGERVTTSIIARPFFVSNEETFAPAEFRSGELIFIWCREEDLQTLQAGYEDAGNVYTVATLAQVRTFENSHTMYTNDFFSQVGVKAMEDSAKLQVVDQNGDPAPGTKRPTCTARWLPAGVCINVQGADTGFIIITLCVQGPTLMRNYFWPGVRPKTLVYIREKSIIPTGYDTKTTSVDMAAEDDEREALTVKTIEAWPNLEAGLEYDRMADIREREITGNPLGLTTGTGWDLHTLGKYYYMEPPISKTVNADATVLRSGGPFYGSALDGLIILGEVLDVYPPETDGTYTHTGFSKGSAFGANGVPTTVYGGDVRILLPPYMGMRPLDVVAMFAARAPAGDD